MKEEITRIMKLVQEGKLSPEDAAELIEAFGGASGESSDEPASESKSEATDQESEKEVEGPFIKLIAGIEKIGKEVSISMDWKDIADQVRSGVNKGAEAIKVAMDDAAKGRGPFSSVFGHNAKRHYDLPLDVPSGKILRLEGISGNVFIEGGHDVGSVSIDATFRAYNEEEAQKAADRYLPLLEENDQSVTLRHGETENLTADVVIRTKKGVPVEAKITSGEVKVYKTGGSVRVTSVSGDVEVRDVEGTVEVSVVSGDVRIEDAAASIMTVESKSGDINLARVSGSLNVRTSSGDVRAQNCGARTFSVEAASGDVTLDINQPVEGAINVRTVSGDIKIDVPDGSDARVMLATLRGAVSTSIDLQDETLEKLTITGRLGEGPGSIDASAVNGDVHLGLRDSSQD